MAYVLPVTGRNSLRREGTDPEPLLVSVRTAAARTGFGRDRMYYLVRSGRVPSVRVGRRILVVASSLEAFVLAEAERQASERGND